MPPDGGFVEDENKRSLVRRQCRTGLAAGTTAPVAPSGAAVPARSGVARDGGTNEQVARVDLVLILAAAVDRQEHIAGLLGGVEVAPRW